ncbi:DUF2809 domain-containing protein [Sungkyunkwania multivorans]|uniref:DUF2809 domain-containing protein n=1 Tax=Sungkyunkwania multivorans TaxID=1173618 RepID=A0ABW3CWL5_9FLAO
MKFRLSIKYILLTVVLFLVEVLIARYGSGFLRHFIGDVLVVILIYAAIRSFLESKNVLLLILGIFVFACTIEGLQLFDLPKILGIEDNKVASIVLGNTFDWMDILAYALGCISIISMERFLTNVRNR